MTARGMCSMNTSSSVGIRLATRLRSFVQLKVECGPGNKATLTIPHTVAVWQGGDTPIDAVVRAATGLISES